MGTVCFIIADDITKKKNTKNDNTDSTKYGMSHRCLTFPWWLSTHRLNTVWVRQPRNPTWEHHETSAIRHVLNSVFKILTNPQNTNHLWFFFFPQQLFNEQRQKREACHLWVGPVKTTQSLWDHPVHFWFYSPYLQHNTRRLQTRMRDFSILVYLYIYQLAWRTKWCFLYLRWRRNAEKMQQQQRQLIPAMSLKGV